MSNKITMSDELWAEIEHLSIWDKLAVFYLVALFGLGFLAGHLFHHHYYHYAWVLLPLGFVAGFIGNKIYRHMIRRHYRS